MAEEALHGADVVAVLQKMSRERVAERVTRDALCEAGTARGLGYFALEHRFVKMVTANLSRFGVTIRSGRWKYPLPAPLPARRRELPRKREREIDPTRTGSHVILVLPTTV